MENEIQNCGAASLQVQNKWVNKGKNRCHWYSKALLQVQQREESLKDVSIWYSKAHLTLFSYLKQRSRIQESSSAPLLFFATEMVLKISWIRYEIKKSSTQTALHSFLCSSCFGLLIVKSQNDVVSILNIYIKNTWVSTGFARAGRVPGGRTGLTRSHRANS